MHRSTLDLYMMHFRVYRCPNTLARNTFLPVDFESLFTMDPPYAMVRT